MTGSNMTSVELAVVVETVAAVAVAVTDAIETLSALFK